MWLPFQGSGYTTYFFFPCCCALWIPHQSPPYAGQFASSSIPWANASKKLLFCFPSYCSFLFLSDGTSCLCYILWEESAFSVKQHTSFTINNAFINFFHLFLVISVLENETSSTFLWFKVINGNILMNSNYASSVPTNLNIEFSFTFSILCLRSYTLPCTELMSDCELKVKFNDSTIFTKLHLSSNIPIKKKKKCRHEKIILDCQFSFHSNPTLNFRSRHQDVV